MALDSTTTKAIATEAWSQLVHSLVSDDPPSDMGPEYYHTFPEVGFDALQKQLKRLEIYKYELGTERIQARLGSQVVRQNDLDHRLGIKHVRGSVSSIKHYKVEQAKKNENQQDIEHIQGCIRSDKHYVPVQANEDGNQQDIEHIQGCIRSNKHSVPVQAIKDGNQQDMEHVQGCIRSNKQSEPVQANEDGNQQEIEHIRGCIRSNKHSELVQENEDGNWPGIDHIRDCIRSNKYFQVVQANKDNNMQGMEHFQDTLGSGMYHELVQEDKHKNQQGFKRIKDYVRSEMFSMPAEYENHPIINYRESMRSTALPLALYELENAYRHLLKYGQAKKLSTLFDELLELVENKDLHGKEKVTLRIQVLKAVKLVHHYGIDSIRAGVKEELEDMNKKYDDVPKNLALLYRKKGLEVMLRICDTEACQRTIYEIIGKAESDQVIYKW